MAAVSKPGPKNLITDISGLTVGNSSDANIKTGTTVLVGDAPFTASVLVMGGAPGTKETDLLAPDKTMEDVDGFVLSGGSAFGLDACSGVMDGLRDAGRGFPVSLKLENGYTVGALVVANPFGSVTTSGGKHFWAAPFEFENEFGGVGIDTNLDVFDLKPTPKSIAMQVDSDQISNTTIAIVATDAPLSKTQCYRMAVAAHDGMVRAIIPSHTLHDGDLVFALSTRKGEIDHETFREIGVASAVCLSRAIARGVYEATSAEHDILSTYKKANKF